MTTGFEPLKGLKLYILTDLDQVISLTGGSVELLTAEGDRHSSCQEYYIEDLDTKEILVSHCNLPAALKEQAI